MSKLSSYDFSAFDSPNFPPLVDGSSDLFSTECVNNYVLNLKLVLTLLLIGKMSLDRRGCGDSELIKVKFTERNISHLYSYSLVYSHESTCR